MDTLGFSKVTSLFIADSSIKCQISAVRKNQKLLSNAEVFEDGVKNVV